MKIELTQTEKKVLRTSAVASAAIAILGVGLAIAAPHQWATSDPLKAADLNGLNVLTTDAGSFSVGATKYCGVTSSTTTGNIGGYAGAKQSCQTACSSTTAHMCTGDELTRSKALGIVINSFSTSYAWYSNPNYGYIGPSNTNIRDCISWTSSVSTGEQGAAWSASADSPNDDLCSNAHPILCCD